MQYNYNKLKGKIVEMYGSQKKFAKEINISERTLSLKLNNKRFFTQDEIEKISISLKIPKEKIHIFFYNKVQ